MTDDPPLSHDPAELRRRAESLLPDPADAQALSPAGTARLLHELQVHKIDLELKNEELMTLRARVEAGLVQYTMLYDIAPVGYATLNADGTIVQTNFACARLLGVDRVKLQGHRLGRFIIAREHQAFCDWLRRVFDSDSPQGGEFSFSVLGAPDAAPSHDAMVVRIEAERAPDNSSCLVVLTDLTPQRAAAAALRTSESRFRDTFEQAAVGIAHVAPDGRWLRINRKLCEIVGYTVAELSRMTFQDITHPDDLGADLQLVQRMLARDINSYTMDKRYLRSDGRVVWCELTVALVRDEAGSPDYFISVVVDIDTRRSAEAARDGAQLRLAGLVDSAMDAIISIDDARHIVLFNPAAEAMFGWRQAELVGQPLDRLLPATARAAHEGHIQGFVATGTTSRRMNALGSLLGIRADGTEFPLEASISQMDVAGKPFCTVILRDISERQCSEALLRQAARQYGALFHANPHPMWIYDLQTQRVLGANDAALARYGYRRETFLSMTAEQLLDPLATADLNANQHIVSADQKRPQLTRHRADGGRLFDVEMSIQSISFEDRPACLVLAHDVSEQRLAAQRATEHRQALRMLLQRLHRAQEDERVRVAREVHDELGQMLTGLKMDLRWIERRLGESGLLANQQPLLDRAEAASVLTEQTIATVQKLAAELRPGALDQLGLAAALAERARQFQQRTGVPCTVTGVYQLPPLPAAVATELFYIAQEALTNVARHAQAHRVEIRLGVQAAAVQMEIEDDGVGIAPDALNAARSLGLLGMRERALLSGGTVAIDPVLPHGTCVCVLVPVTAPPR